MYNNEGNDMYIHVIGKVNHSGFTELNYLCIISLISIHCIENIHLWCMQIPSGTWWDKIKDFVIIHIYTLPTNKYGNILRNINDQINVQKLHIMKMYGGVILDTNIVCILPLYEQYNKISKTNKCIMGNPSKNTNIIIGTKGSKLIELWEKSFLFIKSSFSNVIAPSIGIATELSDIVHIDINFICNVNEHEKIDLLNNSYTLIDFNKYKNNFEQCPLYNEISNEVLYTNKNKNSLASDVCIYNTLPSFDDISEDMEIILNSWNIVSEQRLFYDDVCCRDFIQQKMPKFLTSYDKIIPGAFKSDIWRLCVLYVTGGLYIDTHIRLLNTDLKKIICSYDYIFCIDEPTYNSYIYNAFMFVKNPNSKLILYILNTINLYINKKHIPIDHLSITGPGIHGRCISAYLKIPTNFKEGELVVRGERYLFIRHRKEEYLSYKGVDYAKCRYDKYRTDLNKVRKTKHYSEYDYKDIYAV